MAGELYFLATAGEAQKIKQKPDSIRALDMSARRSLDLDHYGYQLDLALEHIAEQKKDPWLGLAISGGDDIGTREIFIRCVSGKDAAMIAESLGGILRDELPPAFCAANACGDELIEVVFPFFQELVKFYREAAELGAAVVKTIY